MAYDEALAIRIRALLPDPDAEIAERQMFGALAFLLDGHMFAGIVGDELMVLIGEGAASNALARKHVREMDFTGGPAKGMVFVQPHGLTGRPLAKRLGEATDFVQTLPPKAPRHPGQG